MLIKNNEKRVINIGVQLSKPKKDDKTLGKNAVKMVQLVPGNNEIADDLWTDLKKHPQIIKKLENEDLEIVTEKDRDDKETEKDGGAASLPGKAGDAVKVVKKTFSKELLDKWLESENRPSVVKALNDQFKVLELSPEEREAMKG